MDITTKVFFLTFFLSSAVFSAGQTYEQFLKSKFPNCELKKEYLYLSKDQSKRITDLSKTKLYTKSPIRVKVDCKGTTKFAYVDSHKVRTKYETLVVVVGKKDIDTISLISFMEPPEYKPPRKWLDKFKALTLNKELDLKRKIDVLSGATLTSRAAVDSARRILAIHEVY